MPDDVELVVENHHPRAVGLEAPSEGLPHVHHGMGDLPRPGLPKPLPELVKVLLLPPLAHKKHLRPSGPIQGAHQVPEDLAPPHRDLVDAHGADPVQGAASLGPFGHKRQGFRGDPTDGTDHPRLPKPYIGQMLSQGQMLDLLLPAVFEASDRLTALATVIHGLQSAQGQYHGWPASGAERGAAVPTSPRPSLAIPTGL